MDGDALLAELRRVLKYEPETGRMVWLITRQRHGGMIRPGDEATAMRDGYRFISYTDSSGKCHQLRAHRLAWWFMTGKMPTEIDHIDRNRANNAWSNLREVTRAVNNMNTDKLRPKNQSGKRGVSWVAASGSWLARIYISKRPIDLGTFRSVEEAVSARQAAELQYFGAHCPS